MRWYVSSFENKLSSDLLHCLVLQLYTASAYASMSYSRLMECGISCWLSSSLCSSAINSVSWSPSGAYVVSVEKGSKAILWSDMWLAELCPSWTPIETETLVQWEDGLSAAGRYETFGACCWAETAVDRCVSVRGNKMPKAAALWSAFMSNTKNGLNHVYLFSVWVQTF